ncbi:MAG: CbrC family protein [Planctomycetes bacterium]|nr:CbrC family protein [Planctomycetota bacterium]
MPDPAAIDLPPAPPLPDFRFHPDPILSGAIEASAEVCGCCELARGFVYTGPCYVEQEFAAALCPWCIGDGSAYRRFGVTFHELDLPHSTDVAILDEIEERTPGMHTWNPIAWPVCCKLPMAYLEPAGSAEIRLRYPPLASGLVQQMSQDLRVPVAAAKELFSRLHRDVAPTAHVFRCLTCSRLRARIDQD